MTKTATITTRISPELKNNAEQVLKRLGMTTTQAINMFLKQVELHQGLPFDVQLTTPPIHRVQRSAGLHKGIIQTTKDFDAPLDDEFWLGNDQ